MKHDNRYKQIIEKIFFDHYKEGDNEVPFERVEIETVAKTLKIKLPKNIGDIIYTFRYRSVLPESIVLKAPKGMEWVIRPDGQSKYKFVSAIFANIHPSEILSETKVPNATPGIIETYALSDEQALLAKIRYNRLIDIFTGITCYSLQSHLRSNVRSLGQIETDEMYVGIDKKGVHYVIPVQAKGLNDKLGIVQIEQDIALCEDKFPNLIAKPIGAQFISNDLIALFEFEMTEKGISVASEKHYRLVNPDQLSQKELLSYRSRTE
ncbi:endonuclease [bacterium]|nr:endonuclease [bacterium]